MTTVVGVTILGFVLEFNWYGMKDPVDWWFVEKGTLSYGVEIFVGPVSFVCYTPFSKG